MGCSQTNTNLNFKGTINTLKSNNLLNYNYDKGFKNYNNSTDNFFDIFNKNLIDEITRISESPPNLFPTKVDNLWNDHKSYFLKKKMEKAQIEHMVLLQLANLFLLNNKKKILYEVDVHNVLSKIIKEHFIVVDSHKHSFKQIEENEINKLISILSSDGLLPKKQKVFNLYLDKHFNETKYYKSSIYDHILFSDEFKPESINIICTPLLLKYTTLIDMICENIKHSERLYFLNVLIHPAESNKLNIVSYIENFNFDPLMYGILCKILYATLKNINCISFFSLSISNSCKIVMPPELGNILLDIVEYDNLVGLWLGKFSFSNEFFKLLKEKVIELKKLKYLGINGNNINPEIIESLIEIIKNNKSIELLVFNGLNFSHFKNKLHLLKNELQKNECNILTTYINNKYCSAELIEDDSNELENKIGGVFINK